MDWLYEFDEEVYKEIAYRGAREAERRAIIERALRNGHTPQQVSDFNGIPLGEVLDVQKEMLWEAK